MKSLKQRTGLTLLICTLMPALLILSSASAFCAPETVTVDWPLDGSGSDWTQLKAPFGYFFPLDNISLVPRKELIQKMHREQGLPAVQKVSLWASWPGMEIPTAKTPEDFHGRAGSNTMFLRLESWQSLQSWAKTWLDAAGTICQRPNTAKTHSDLTCNRGVPLVQLLPEFDLQHRGIEVAKRANSYRASFYNDIYYVPDLGNSLATFISCSEEENHPLDDERSLVNASCEQIFIVPSLNATARVGYNREYLKDWRAIQQAWIQKLQSFVVQ
jgi:hypothetical protein